MKKQVIKIAFVMMGFQCLAWAAPNEPPARDPKYYEEEIVAFEKSDRTSMPPQGGIEFIGASAVRLWKSLPEDFNGLPVYNRGFGGSQLEDLVYYADRIVIPYKPRVVVVRGGGNDISHGKSAERVLSDFKKFVEKVRRELPDTRIMFTAIYPGTTDLEFATEERRANQLIREYISTQANMEFIDIATPMLADDGKANPKYLDEDGLHPSPAGYRLWAKIIAKSLNAKDSTTLYRHQTIKSH